MDKRTLLAIGLSILVIMVYQIFFFKPRPVQRPVPVSNQQAMTEKQTGKETSPTAAKENAPINKLLAAEKTAVREQEVRVDTPLYTAIFTNRGGALKSFALKNYRKKLDKKSDNIELVDIRTGSTAPLSISFPESSLNLPQDSIYEADVQSLDLNKKTESGKLVFSQKHEGKMKVEKIFTFTPNKYSIDLETKVTNLSEDTLNQNACLTWHQYVDPKKEVDSYSHEGPVTLIPNGVEREEVKKIETEKVIGPNVSWSGFESKYFIASLIPQNPTITTVSIEKSTLDTVSVSLKGPKNPIPPAQSVSFNYSLYLGPKDYSLLKSQGVGLEDAIDFGSWLKWLAMPLLLFLKFLYQYIHNYGIAIIILTTLIKIIFWPLGNISYRSMKEMQKLQPKMAELRERFKDDKAKMNQEVMALYKTHKVNPFGGCLPMIIQIPVFFGLYKALLYSIELRHAPFFGWIQDLSDKDPYYITPIIMGATMFIQQKMTPATGDPMQQKIMMWMPVIFTFLFVNFPSGLVIYWLFNNILSIGQQYYINKQ